MEFVCQLCLANRGKICDQCLNRRQIAPFSVSAIHQPVPDKEKPLRCISVFQTAKDKDGQARAADDWQIRANIKHLWNEGKLRSKPEIDSFSVEFSVEASLVQECVNHLANLEKVSTISAQQRAATNRKKNTPNVHHDYEWKDLVKSGGIQKLLVRKLDKYLNHHRLSTSGKKDLKMSSRNLCTYSKTGHG